MLINKMPVNIFSHLVVYMAYSFVKFVLRF